MPGSRRPTGSAERVITTVLFTDIVGSTELATELGDRRWRQVISAHHAFVRGMLKRYGGREVDTAGDGFFATFDHAARAIGCACEIADGLWDRGLRIRAGLHVGEVEQSGRSVRGVAVHIGSRVASKAAPGEVLATGTLRDLVAGSDVRFADRGRHQLKGVPGEWQLFAVAREAAPEGTPAAAPPPLTEQAEAARSWFLRRRPQVIGALALAVAAAIFFAVVSPGVPASVTPGPQSIGRLDTTSNRFVAAVPVGREPSAIVAGAGSLWVLNVEDQTVSRIDPASNKVVTTRAVGGTPTGIAFGDGSVWVAAGFGLTSGAGGSVLELDPATNELGRPIHVGSGLRGIAFGFGSIWVTNKNANTVTRIDPETGGLIATITVGAGPEGVAVGGTAVWVANSLEPTVTRIDPKTNKVAGQVPLRDVPNAIAASADAVWVISTTANLLTRIDPDRATIVTTLVMPAGPVGVAAADGDAWVASLAGAVTRIDAETNRRVALIPVRGTPWGIAATGDLVWVSVRP